MPREPEPGWVFVAWRGQTERFEFIHDSCEVEPSHVFGCLFALDMVLCMSTLDIRLVVERIDHVRVWT